jgi:hypothetical protein
LKLRFKFVIETIEGTQLSEMSSFKTLITRDFSVISVLRDFGSGGILELGGFGLACT